MTGARTVIEGAYVATVDAADTEHVSRPRVIDGTDIVAVGAGPAPAWALEGPVTARRRDADTCSPRVSSTPTTTSTSGSPGHRAGLDPLRLADRPLPDLVEDRRRPRGGRRARRHGGARAIGLHHHRPITTTSSRRTPATSSAASSTRPAGSGCACTPPAARWISAVAGRAAARLRRRDDRRRPCRPAPMRSRRFHDPSRDAMVQIALAPCSPFSVTADLLRESAVLARAARACGCTPTARRPWRRTRSACERSAARPTEYLDDLGWLGDDVWMAHCVHLDDHAIARFAATGTGSRTAPRRTLGSPPASRRSRSCSPPGCRSGSASTASASNESGQLGTEIRHVGADEPPARRGRPR